MKTLKFNRSALCLVTLFLLVGFSDNIFGRQISGENSRKLFQAQMDKAKTAVLSPALTKNRATIFPDKSSPGSADVFPPSNKQTATNYVRPNKDERFKKYLSRTFGGYALIGDVASAGFAQIVDTPEEWENNSKGFGRRLASTVGKSIIKETVTYGLDEAFKLDSNYYKSSNKSFKARLKNAFLSTVTARKPDGKRVIGFPRIAGAFTGAIIANQFWYPSNYDYKDGLSSGAISLGTSIGVNFLREFF